MMSYVIMLLRNDRCRLECEINSLPKSRKWRRVCELRLACIIQAIADIEAAEAQRKYQEDREALSGISRPDRENFVQTRFGYCFYEITGDYAFIYNLLVHPEFRGQGKARRLLQLVIEEIRAKKSGLLSGAKLPLPGLSIEDGELIYNGQKWDCMSGSEKLIVSTAISRSINPECGFILLDGAEQFDLDQLAGFAAWAVDEGLQIIATRVSTGDECSIIIEDGEAVEK